MMTNPLLKVTLILLSLISAVFVGQVMLHPAQHSPVIAQGVPVQAPAPEDPIFETRELHSTQNLGQSSRQKAISDAATSQDTVPVSSRQSSAPSRDSHRSFSFHYLDILEWMFAGRGEKARQRQPERPAPLSAW